MTVYSLLYYINTAVIEATGSPADVVFYNYRYGKLKIKWIAGFKERLVFLVLGVLGAGTG